MGSVMHMCPHWPQFVTLFFKSTQFSPQMEKFGPLEAQSRQDMSQVPLLASQASFGLQVLVQLPQCERF